MEYLLIGLGVGMAIGLLITYLCMRKVARDKIDRFITGTFSSNETIRAFLSRHLSTTEMLNIVDGLKSNLSAMIYSRVSDRSVSTGAAHMIVTKINYHVAPHGERDDSKHGLFRNAANMVVDAVKARAEAAIENNQPVIEENLGNKINEVITKNGKSVISDIVNDEVEKILSMPMSRLFEGNEQLLISLKQKMIGK